MNHIRTSLLAIVLVAVSCHADPYDRLEPVEEEVVESGWEPMRTVEGEELEEDEIAALVGRLPELEVDEDDEVEFKRRDDSLPPPLKGETFEGDWPPDLSAEVAETAAEGPFRAQAFRSEGEVEPPFQVAVGFDRPVVEVGAVGTQEAPPVEMTPEIEGRWRWLGTRTVVFEPDEEWPMATEFDIAVDRGLEAVDGARLEESLRFSFATPGPEVVRVYPDDRSLPRDVPVAVVFNQPIDEATVEAISLYDPSEVPMEVAGGELRAEIAGEYGIEEADEEGRVMVLVPQREYDYDTTVRVAVNGPIQSREGPVVGMESHSSTFETYGEFKMRHWYPNTYSQGQRIPLYFSNPIDPDVEPEVEVSPAVDELAVEVSGDRIWVDGNFLAYKDYEIGVDPELTDVFGQQLTVQEEDAEIGRYPPPGGPRKVSIAGYRTFVTGPDQTMVVRPKNAAATLPLMTAEAEEFRVRVFDVNYDDWPRFLAYRRHDADDPGGRLVGEQTHRFGEEERRQVRPIDVDVTPALSGGLGQAVVTVDSLEPWGDDRREFRRAYWVQRTDLGVDLSSDYQEMTASVTRLSDGGYVAGAQIAVGDSVMGETDSVGDATFSVPRGDDEAEPVRVRDGDDEIFIPVQGRVRSSRVASRWWHRTPSTNVLWYVVDDRQIYRPGETVTIRGWLRSLEESPRSEPQGVGEGTVSYTVREPRGNDIAEGSADIDGFGGFEFQFDVPEEANLGAASIRMKSTVGGSHSHGVEFQEFRRPEFEVGAATDEAPHRVAERTGWEAEASYYAGGALSAAPVTWRFSESSASYTPPGWSRWNFGQWRSWWSWWRSGDSGGDVLPEEFRDDVQGVTDGEGRHSVAMRFDRPDRGFARRVEGTVSVQDVDRQAWEATESVLVHPSDLYVGLRSEDNFISDDRPWVVDAVAVDVDGEVVEGRDIDIALNRRRFGDLDEVERCRETSEDEAVSCSFSDLAPGSYRAVATVEDDEGRVSESEIDVFVSGQDYSGAETAEEDELLLVPERDEYAPGDTARIAVQAPYYPLDAVMELRRDGSYHRERVEIREEDPTVEFEVEEQMIPNVNVRVAAVADGESYAPDHFASGSLKVEVDPGPRTLDVDVTPARQAIGPGDELEVEARVTDHDGDAVEGAQVLLFAVDEAVLALTDYVLADPVQTFYPRRSSRMHYIRSRAWLLLDLDDDVADEFAETAMELGGAAYGAGALGSAASVAGAPDPIDVREVFDALAFHRSDLVSDAEGRVHVAEEMPDSLTRYRVMAVAVGGDTHFGTGESDVTAKKPVMVSASPPRFLNVGDHFDFPVVLHNRTEDEQSVEVVLEASPTIQWLESPGRRVDVPAEGRIEVRFAGRVDRAGTAKLHVAAVSGEHDDAEFVEFPVLTPATTEAFATYGTIDADDEDAVLEALNVPQDVYTQFGGVEISASSTQLQALTDAFIYLTNYPFYCSEQLSSRILSVLALYDVLDAFDASDLPASDEIRAEMEGWIAELVQMQRGDGGFGFWPRARRSHPMVTVHATHALHRAREAGYDVDERRLDRAENFLRNISPLVSDYPERSRAAVEAYALHVRHQMGESGLDGDFDTYLGRFGVDEIPLEAVGWLLPLAEGGQFEERFMQRILNQVQETAATAEFQETYDRGAHRVLHTTRRTDGVVLDGLMRVEPDHYLVEKVARGLLAHRQRGRWSNTQENVFILMALRRYFDTYEGVEPDFVARAWLGAEHVAEHAFEGRTTERYGAEVPMRYLHGGADTLPVTFQRDGVGRMYYRMGVRYAPRSRRLDPLDEGFAVERTYEAVDDPEDVRRTDEGWEIRAGARVRVELSMTVPARRYHVALVDWLPAGLEPLNPALSVTSVDDDLTAASSDARRWRWWARPWYEHQNLRDERVEAFSSLVSQGVHTYSYVARATTPGQFIAMPVKAEEMYHPETFGRSMSEIVTVVDE